MNFDINFDFNFWSILFLIAGYALGSFTKRVGTSNEIDQIIRDAAQIQATNRKIETQNDKLNDTLFESTKENQRLLNENKSLMDRVVPRKPFLDFENDNNSIYREPMHMREEGQRPWQTIED